MIPIYINTFNRLTTTKNLAGQIARLPNVVPIIVDNNSDYEPLREWLNGCDYKVIQVGENAGHLAPWRFIPGKEEFKSRWGQPYYGITDCDLSIEGIPDDVLEVLTKPFFFKGQPVIKSGLSLRIRDLPDWQHNVMTWESQWWNHPIENGKYYLASIDTTFFLTDIRFRRELVQASSKVMSLRSAPPYEAIHVPWYLDCESLDEENKYYFQTSHQSASWKPCGRGLRSPGNDFLENPPQPPQSQRTVRLHARQSPQKRTTPKKVIPKNNNIRRGRYRQGGPRDRQGERRRD